LQLIYHFVGRCLEVNRNSSDGLDGVHLMNLIVAILENMQGTIDGDLPQIINLVANEIAWLSGKKGYKNYRSMTLQALSMCFTYNPV